MTQKKGYSNANLGVDNNLEPRVARVETGLEMLTRDVASLVQVVREQGSGIENQIRELAIGVTQAAAPRRTYWQTLIAMVMLIMAIGSAVFWPLNQTANENRLSLQRMEQNFSAHVQLQLHPVGQALLGRLEDQLISHIKDDDRDKETIVKQWERQIDTTSERINARLNKLESKDIDRNNADLSILKTLREKMLLHGLSDVKQEDR